jgi:hypothetical protein
MKILIAILFLCSSFTALGQTSSSKMPAQYSEAFRADLQTKLGIDHDKAVAALGIISQANNKMTAVAKQKIDKTQKLRQFTAIASERDAQIARLLSYDQVQQLKAFMIKQRELAMSKKK